MIFYTTKCLITYLSLTAFSSKLLLDRQKGWALDISGTLRQSYVHPILMNTEAEMKTYLILNHVYARRPALMANQ